MQIPRPSLAFVVIAAIASLVATPAFAQARAGLLYADIPATAYAVVAEIQAKPGKEDALRQATLPLVAQVRAEPNNLLYFLQEDREKPGHFIFYEIFATEADFEAHNATPHVQAWFKLLPDLAVGEVKATRMQILNNQPRP
jgi:quinol monooxygenase YgiN